MPEHMRRDVLPEARFQGVEFDDLPDALPGQVSSAGARSGPRRAGIMMIEEDLGC